MGKRRKKTFFGESAWNNNTAYSHYIQRLIELAISMFEYKNLPDTVDERYLELTLFSDGVAVFFEDEVLGYLALQTVNRGNFDVYRYPKNRRAFSVSGYQKELTDKDSVLIYNNYLHTNTYPLVEYYAKRLWNIDRIIDVNVNAQKTPVLITCSDTQRLSMLNLYQQYDGNAPVIFGTSDLNVKDLKVLKTDAPYVAQQLYELRTQIWNEALTYLGITNVNIQKKERLVSDEVVRSTGGVIASRYSRLESRRQAVEKINEMFGLEIEVNYRDDFREADDEVMLEGDTGENKMTDQVIDLRTN